MPPIVLRVIVVMAAIVAAMAVAGLTLALGLLGPDLLGGGGDPRARTSFWLLFFLSTNLAVKVGILPAFLASAAAEGLRIRSAWFFAGCGAAVALVGYFSSGFVSLLAPGAPVAPLPHEIAVVAASGVLAGLAYWALAGRKAGAWRLPAAAG